MPEVYCTTGAPHAAAAPKVHTTGVTPSTVELSRQFVGRVSAYLIRAGDGLTLGLYSAECSLVDMARSFHGAESAARHALEIVL
ncbi:MAG: hypothetical protein ACREV7_13130 [Steroidobacteraceae bacterium]